MLIFHIPTGAAVSTAGPRLDKDSGGDNTMPKPSRWTPEKRYEIVMETLRGKESISAIARKHQVSDALIHRWRDRFFRAGKAALAMEARGASSEMAGLEHQIEELQQVIGEQSVEIRFLKRLSRK